MKIDVNLCENSYDILVERGNLKQIGSIVCSVYQGKKIAIVSDSNVSGFYLDLLMNELQSFDFICESIIIPAGEQSKNFDELENICNFLSQRNFHRTELLITLGGGVIGDLAGFAAASYMRGMPYLHIPTSLLAMVDSSVGGKVAINLKKGKNLVGTFYQPKTVIIDPELLASLPKKEYDSAFSEIIKYALIRDPHMYDQLMELPDKYDIHLITEMIILSCKHKKFFIEKDERESFARMFLNFGHSFAHAIENFYHYETFNHGQAVGMGMKIAADVSFQLKICNENTVRMVHHILDRYQFDTEHKMKADDFFHYMQLDKKNLTDTVRLILLESVGKSVVRQLSSDELKRVLTEVIK